jgi:hypothetical protein
MTLTLMALDGCIDDHGCFLPIFDKSGKEEKKVRASLALLG